MDQSTQQTPSRPSATARPISTSNPPQTNQSDSEHAEESDDYTSSSGSSSDDEEEASDEEDATHSSQGPTSTQDESFPLSLTSSSGRTITMPRSELASRIADFLPSLVAANERLQQEQAQEGGASRTLEVGDDEDEPHVDMNVALGVLEEVRDSDPEDSDKESSEGEKAGETDKTSEAGEKRKADDGADALGDLMGRKKKAKSKSKSKPAIEEVAEEKPSG